MDGADMEYSSWERRLELGPHGSEDMSLLKVDRMENDIGSMRGSWGWKKIQFGLTLTCRKQQEKRFNMNNVEIRNFVPQRAQGTPADSSS